MTITKEYLLANGFERNAGPYKMPQEDRMFSACMKQHGRKNAIYAALWGEDMDWVEVWTVPNVKYDPPEDQDDNEAGVAVLA